MKRPLLLLAAAGALVASIAMPHDARAGEVSLNLHIGVPLRMHPVPVYRPHVVYEPVYYRPIIAYRAPVIYAPPLVRYRPAHYDYRYDGRHRGHSSAYPSYGGNRRFAEVQMNPRLGR